MHPQVVVDAVEAIQHGGGAVSVDQTTDLLTVNGEFTASIVISRCVEMPSGALRWSIRLDTGLRPDITIAIRMDAGNQTALDYYLLPRVNIAGSLRLREDNRLSLDGFRYDSIDAFFYSASRIPIRRTA